MRDVQKGTYNGDTTYCPVNAYGNCPYCDQCNVCHIEDPQADCDDWASVWDNWDEWLKADDVDPDAPDTFSDEEIEWAKREYGYHGDRRIYVIVGELEDTDTIDMWYGACESIERAEEICEELENEYPNHIWYYREVILEEE